MLNLNYDAKNDVLYISLGKPRDSYGDEIKSGVVLLKDIETDETTGVTILGYKKKLHDNKFDFYDIPINIDFTHDVIPYIS